MDITRMEIEQLLEGGRDFRDSTKWMVMGSHFDDYRNESLRIGFPNGDEIETTRKELMVNLIVLPIFPKFGVELEPELWFDSEVYGSDMAEYFDMAITALGEVEDVGAVNRAVAEAIAELSSLAVDANVRIGSTVNLWELGRVCDEVPRLDEILHTDMSAVGDFRKVELRINELMREAEDLLSEHSQIYKALLRNTNSDQFKQILVSIGPKPNLFGEVIPELPDTNFMRGLRNVQDFFLMSETARKVLITTHRSVRQSGYLTRKLSLLTIDTLLSEEDDCGTQHCVKFEITDEDALSRIKGRWYKETTTSDELVMVDPDNESLIGKTIFLRSPMTCAGTDVCRTCYGDLWRVNKDMHVGIVAVLFLTSQFTQRLLSAKHLLQTRSPDLDWGEKFLMAFSVDRSIVTVLPDFNATLVLDDDDVEDDESTGEKYITGMTLTTSSRELRIPLPAQLYFTDDFQKALPGFRTSEGKFEIKLKDFVDEVIFSVFIQNEEITQSLNQIKALIENKDHLGAETIDEMVSMMFGLLSGNGILLDMIHIECIMRNLIRDPEDISERPDFHTESPDYVILRLADSILHGKSVTVGLSFENLKQQLNSARTFRKEGSSLIDCFFER